MKSRTFSLRLLVFSIRIFGFAVSVWSADDLVSAAKKEAEVNLYLSTDLNDANGMIQSFKKKYPFIEVKFFRAGNEKLLSRILTETAADKFNGDVILISSFAESGNYPEGFTDKEGYWTSVYSIPRVIA